MAKRARPVEIAEHDLVPGFAHPRATANLIGQGEALARASRAIREGRPPQAWLICGAPGIGKATFAYRIARYLLAYGAGAEGPADLSVPDNDGVAAQVAAQVAAGSHPGLLVLKRGINPKTGKLMSELPVGEIRRLAGFFGMTSGAGGWRVAIVDTADEMNEAAANALLKLLEEPPRHAMLLLLAGTPGRLLPTIRSRCRRIDLRALDVAEEDAALAGLLPDMDADARASLARLSGGSIGAALRLADGDGAMLALEADRLIDRAHAPDFAALLALGEKIARMGDGLEIFGEFLGQALCARIRGRAGEAGLGAYAELQTRIAALFARSSALNLEPHQTILTAAREIARARA